MVEQLTIYVVRNNIRDFTKLKALKYREMRNLYQHLPSHYVYTACQDVSIGARSFLRLKKLELEREITQKTGKLASGLMTTCGNLMDKH